MRWLVEVTSLGKSERDSLYVDADSWQKALTVARTLRGENEPMSGFSIELLDEGCRAVDPVSRMSYEVVRAPEDGRPAVPMRASAAPRVTPASVVPASAAPSVSAPPGPPSGVIERQEAPPAPSIQPAAPDGQQRRSHVPRPQISAHATMMLGNSARSSEAPQPPQASLAAAAPSFQAFAPALSSAPAAAKADERRSVPPPASSGLPSQIVFKREQDATEALPLTYREYVYVVPPGSTEMAAATLVQAQLELVRASLERVPAGKLVNLAVFDTTFQGRPPVPPLATLTWKDWRGVALVSLPRQPGRSPITIPMGGPPPPVQPAPVFAPPAAAPQAFAPQAFAPQAFAPQAFAPPVTAPPPPVAVHAHAPPPAPAAVPSAPPFAPPPTFAPAFTPAPPSFAPAQLAPQGHPFAPQSQPVAAVGAPQFVPAPQFPPPAIAFETPAPPYGRPLTSPVAPPVQPAPTEQAPEAQGPPSVRVYGEDLIADLFESMHELHFARDAVEGGDYCLSLAMTKLPSLAGIVEFYDIDRREFLVACTRGPGVNQLLLRRYPETDAVLAAAMRQRRAIVIPNAAETDAATNERYVAAGGARSLMVAPVMLAGRFLGAIELLNPIDGEPFTPSDGNAITYIADQFAQFLSENGIVTDPERISVRSPR